MLPYQSLISFDEKINIPMYRYIANRLIALIQQGKLLPGTFLPGTREMAAMINVHRNTVINAYNELISQGWLKAINRKGFQVIPELPIVKPRSFHPEQKYSVPPPQNTGEFIDNFIDFRFIPATTRRPDIIVNDGFPDITLAPVDELMREYRKTMKGEVMKGLLAEKQYAGNDELRQATALFLNQTRGLNISAPNILITRGAQMAIYIAASLLLKPGDEIIVSNPSYFIADGIFQNKGARINYIPVDQDGIDVDVLEELLQRKKIKLLYVIPHHHHPTTVTLSASRRIKLLNLIQRYKLWVIEEDYDYDFHYHNSPILPLASADHSGQIVYIGSYKPDFVWNLVCGAKKIREICEISRISREVCGAGGNVKNHVIGSLSISIFWLLTLLTVCSPNGY
ncbi:PLP-dependent aminotransferase family protein [Mucilaginibacter sp. CAU 1740]|uniref:aminotransferase-like domain-containing protein n=1 Tax=Mucilaginibacter sp. CAU 1740 TaxID=3140365 RepID=UPI00325ABAB4